MKTSSIIMINDFMIHGCFLNYQSKNQSKKILRVETSAIAVLILLTIDMSSLPKSPNQEKF